MYVYIYCIYIYIYVYIYIHTYAHIFIYYICVWMIHGDSTCPNGDDSWVIHGDSIHQNAAWNQNHGYEAVATGSCL